MDSHRFCYESGVGFSAFTQRGKFTFLWIESFKGSVFFRLNAQMDGHKMQRRICANKQKLVDYPINWKWKYINSEWKYLIACLACLSLIWQQLPNQSFMPYPSLNKIKNGLHPHSNITEKYPHVFIILSASVDMLNTESEKKNNNKCALMHFYITERLSHPSFLYILQFCDLKKHNMSKHVQYIRQKQSLQF